MIALDWGASSEAGRVRESNEDSLLALPPIFAVADGMGGHAAGEVASGIAVQRLEELVGRGTVSVEEVADAIRAANDAVIRESRQTAASRGMGTTLVGLALVAADGGQRWMLFNVGDSRLYRYADGALVQISHDHSEVQELIDAGVMTPEEARVSPKRNIVTRSIGSDPGLEVDYWILDVVEGERYIVCSDGLYTEVTDDAISEMVAGSERPAEAAAALVERAVANGGNDNVSVIVVEVVSLDDDPLDDDTAPRSAVMESIPNEVWPNREEAARASQPIIEDVPIERDAAAAPPQDVISDVPGTVALEAGIVEEPSA